MRRTLLGLMLLVWAGSVVAAPDDLTHEEMVGRFRQQMRQVLSQIPNYTCLETIQRSARMRRAKVFSPLDSVLLEVSNLGGKELLAWPGARRFEDADPSSFVNGGLMGSGIFALYARTVLLHGTANIQYHGDEEMAGGQAARFDFSVAEAVSPYQIRANGTTVKVGMAGSFWFDPASLELLRLEVRADEVPAKLGIKRTAAWIDYARMRIGESGVLLPQAAELNLTLLSGEIRRNDIEFSHCHEYRSETSIRFDVPDTPAAGPAAAVRTVDLPAGLTVPIELESGIDSGTAHVGDVLRGHVVKDVLQKGKPVIPKGAAVTGRIRGMDRISSPWPGFDLTIELADLEWENSSAQFYGELLAKDSVPAEDSAPGVESGDGTMALPSAIPVVPEMRTVQIPGTGVLHMTGMKFRIAPGLRMSWRTLEPNERLKQPR